MESKVEIYFLSKCDNKRRQLSDGKSTYYFDE